MSNYVKFLRDTTPYINQHRGKVFVLAVSGEAVADANFNHLIQDIALLNSLGIKLVLVHGARPQIEQRLKTCNITASFDCNQRITDSASMDCVKDAVGSTRITIESLLSMDRVNSPMHGAQIQVASGNFVTAKPLGVRDGIDFHHTGEVRRVHRDAIQHQLEQNSLVLISPVGYSPTGEAFNLNHEDVATQTAIALKAEKLMVFTANQGLTDAQGVLQKILELKDVSHWLTQLPDDHGLHQALSACYQACQNGVPRAHIISHQEDGALLTELFTREGSGTLILKDNPEQIRPATIDDVGGLLELLTPLEEQGVLVRRSRELLEAEISQFYVLVNSEGMIASCVALYPFDNHQSAELACVVTHPDFRRQGFAERLLQRAESDARKLGLKHLFVLTTQTAHWFLENGFEQCSLEQLPIEKQSLYNLQRNSKILSKQI